MIKRSSQNNPDINLGCESATEKKKGDNFVISWLSKENEMLSPDDGETQ